MKLRRYSVVGNHDVAIIDNDDQSPLATVHLPPGHDVDDRDRFARLVAAAPELLEALRGLGREYSITGWHSHECHNGKSDIDDPCAPFCARARALLDRIGGAS